MGRIYEERGAREDQCWVWSLFGILANPPGMHTDGRAPTLEAGTNKHQHAHAIIWTNARLAQACGELADARRQRAVAQRFLCAPDRGMLRPGELQTVQQAIFDRVHY